MLLAPPGGGSGSSSGNNMEARAYARRTTRSNKSECGGVGVGQRPLESSGAWSEDGRDEAGLGASWKWEVDEEAGEVDDGVEEGDDGTRLGAWWEWGALALGRELRTARRLEPS